MSVADAERQWYSESQGMRSLGSSPTPAVVTRRSPLAITDNVNKISPLSLAPLLSLPVAVASAPRQLTLATAALLSVPVELDVEFGALHSAFRRVCDVTEAVQPRRRRQQREIAEEVMRWLGMSDGVGTAGFEVSTESATLSSPESLAWFAVHESRFKDGDWPRRPPCTTAESMGRLIADLVQRWVDMPVAVHRAPATGADADVDVDAGAGADAAGGYVSGSVHRPQQVIFTFGDAAWLRRIAGVAEPESEAARSGAR